MYTATVSTCIDVSQIFEVLQYLWLILILSDSFTHLGLIQVII